jgi:hypothetical protein
MTAKHLLPLLFAAGMLLAPGMAARAQGPYVRPAVSPNPTPPVSPYLNLLRSGSSPAINYFGLVRPEIDFRNSLQQIQQQISGLPGAAGYDPNAPLSTGHPTQFMNYSHYFGNNPARGMSTGRTGLPPVAPSYATGGATQTRTPSPGAR